MDMWSSYQSVMNRTRCTSGLSSQPERCPGRLHGLLDHRQQVGSQRVQVDLLAQPRAERVDGPCRVVAAAIEATVDQPLDASAGGLEEGGQRQGRRGDDQAVVPAEPLAQT